MAKQVDTPWLHSKTSYMRGRQCVKAMYLHRFMRDKKTKDSEDESRIKNKGFSFENQYQKLHFPNGIDLKQEYGQELEKYVIKTQELLKKNETFSIFEAAIVAHNTFVMLDILHKNKNETFDVYELKNSTKMKASILWDASLQYYICKSVFGNMLNSFSIILKGRNNTFKTIEISKQAEKKQARIIENLVLYSQVLTAAKAPHIEMGKHCNIPYECAYKNHCRNSA